MTQRVALRLTGTRNADGEDAGVAKLAEVVAAMQDRMRPARPGSKGYPRERDRPRGPQALPDDR